VAESLAETVLVSTGWTPVAHFAHPGPRPRTSSSSRRGLTSDHRGQGTLVPARRPHVGRGRPSLMSAARPPTASKLGDECWAATSEDVCGAIAVVDFVNRFLRVALTSDSGSWCPAERVEGLPELDWLDR
jgi:hypothetical protein